MTQSIWQNLGWRVEALAWDGFNAIFRSMGLEKASDFGSSVLRRIGPMTPVHNVARVNIQRCFPDASAPEVDRLLERAWDNFGRLVGENPNMRAFAPDQFYRHAEIVGAEQMKALEEKGQPYVIVAGHFSNWEVGAAAIAKLGLNCVITYRHANNPLIDQRIMQTRRDYGTRLLTAKGGVGARDLLSSLGGGTSVALMNDQKMNDGIEVPFFGYPTMTAPGPARMAMRFKAPIIPLGIRRLTGAKHRVTFYPPIEHSTLENKSDALAETVTRICQWTEERIKEAPEQWFWVHRRWAKDIYRKD